MRVAAAISRDRCGRAGSWRLCLALLLVVICAGAAAGRDAVIEIDRATRAAVGSEVREPVALPDSWNRSGREGTWEYTLGFDGPTSSEPWAIYLPRAGNRFAVHLNGQQIGRFGRFEADLSDHAQRPHFLFLPDAALRAGANELRIVVQGERARYAGLAPVAVGPAHELRLRFVWREALQTWGSFAIVAISLALGLSALALARRSRDRSFGVFSAACLFCALRTSYALVSDPPMDYRLWAGLLDASYAGYLVCLCLFCTERLQLRNAWIGWATAALLAGVLVLVPLSAWAREAWARQALLALMVLYAFALCLAVIAAWYRQRTPASRVLAAAGGVAVALAVHDHVLVFYTRDGYGSFALARYSLITFVVAMAWLLVDRYARQSTEEARLREQVAAELARRTQDLEAQFDRQQQLAAENAQAHERRRLLQDLHDGMGLQLNGLLGMLQQGPLQRDELSREVRTAIEQMRMLMDSAEGFEGDVSILLGHIRYRIEQRLQRQGIRLVWDVQLAQPQRVLPPARAIALQRLVFELATNTLKHAGAREAMLWARDGGDAGDPLRLVFEDDGRGIRHGVAAGMGTRSIARRAEDLGARLWRRDRDGGGTHVGIEILAEAFLPPHVGRGAADAPPAKLSGRRHDTAEGGGA